MDNERKKRVIDAMISDNYEKGDFIIRENDIGSEIFVSEKGNFEIIKGDEIIDTLGAEIVFGELAILYNAKRFASVRAATKVKVWKIERHTFRNIMLVSGNKEREENLSFLRRAEYLKELPESCIVKIVDLLKRVSVFLFIFLILFINHIFLHRNFILNTLLSSNKGNQEITSI